MPELSFLTSRVRLLWTALKCGISRLANMAPSPDGHIFIRWCSVSDGSTLGMSLKLFGKTTTVLVTSKRHPVTQPEQITLLGTPPRSYLNPTMIDLRPAKNQNSKSKSTSQR